MKNMTYFHLDDNGNFRYCDGFYCGSWKMEYLETFVEEHKNTVLGRKGGSLCMKRWKRLVEENKAGNLKPGMHWCWFDKNNTRTSKAFEKFVKKMIKSGYMVDETWLADSFRK